MRKTITYENVEHTQTLDANGNLKEQTRKSKSKTKVETEPHFIKLYIQDICLLNKIPMTGNHILNVLLTFMNYENEIILNSGIKRRITANLNISMGTLDNNLSKLVKLNIMKRIDTGIYKLNPNLFGKGHWTDIKEIRATWIYGNGGRALTGLAVDKAIQEDLEDIEKLNNVA